jgi:hypothetical protein
MSEVSQGDYLLLFLHLLVQSSTQWLENPLSFPVTVFSEHTGLYEFLHRHCGHSWDVARCNKIRTHRTPAN